jgi:hypothetical protein
MVLSHHLGRTEENCKKPHSVQTVQIWTVYLQNTIQMCYQCAGFFGCMCVETEYLTLMHKLIYKWHSKLCYSFQNQFLEKVKFNSSVRNYFRIPFYGSAFHCSTNSLLPEPLIMVWGKQSVRLMGQHITSLVRNTVPTPLAFNVCSLLNSVSCEVTFLWKSTVSIPTWLKFVFTAVKD